MSEASTKHRTVTNSDSRTSITGCTVTNGNSRTSITGRIIQIVIWNKEEKIINYYTINRNTTIQEIINYLQLKNVCMALLGKNDCPFKLLPCDWSDFKDDCKANDFSVNLGDLLMSSPHNIPNIEKFLDNYDVLDYTKEERSELKEKVKEMFCYNKDLCNGHSIHLFLYNHKENDLCTVGYDEWSKKDWNLTTDESSLWLKLERDFLTKKMNDNYDWTKATIDDTEAITNATNTMTLK